MSEGNTDLIPRRITTKTLTEIILDDPVEDPHVFKTNVPVSALVHTKQIPAWT
jgi:hypothetical protein